MARETKREWLKIRSKWLKAHPPNHQGYYECYLCHTWINYSEITLDHIIPKSNASNYSSRHDWSNLAPCCGKCNSEKGSQHGETYQEKALRYRGNTIV